MVQTLGHRGPGPRAWGARMGPLGPWALGAHSAPQGPGPQGPCGPGSGPFIQFFLKIFLNKLVQWASQAHQIIQKYLKKKLNNRIVHKQSE